MKIIGNLMQDVRYAVRQLRRSPGFAMTTIVTLALSVGATAAMVGVLRATLLNPLPYSRSGQLVAIADKNLKGFESNGLVSVLRTSDLAGLKHDGHPVFSGVGFYYSDDSTLAVGDQTASGVAAFGVSDNFFSTVGTAPLLGRTVTASDGVRNAPEVVVLSYRLWQSKFAGDSAVIGRAVRLGTVQASVIGVMPEQFNLPAGTELWHHGHISAANFGGYRGEGSRFVQVVARLDASETVASARQQCALLSTQLATAYPESDAAWAFDLVTLRDLLFGDYRRALLLIAAAVGLVLLVATVNLAGLQLSRNASRVQEFSVRCALGVTRARLVRQLLTESTLLVFMGSLAGVMLAALILRGAVSLLPNELMRVERPHIDLWVLAFSCATALAVGLFTGTFPALRAASTELSLNGARTTMGRPKALGRGFAALQIALALVLLTLSAAVVRNLYALLHTPLGYDAAELQTFTVDLPWGFDRDKAHRIYQSVEEGLSAMPGVESVGSATALPLSSFSSRSTFDIAGAPPTPHHDAVTAQARNFSPGYLHTMRTPLLAGREFTAQDSDPKTPSVLLINQTLANRYFAGRNPIGQRLTTPVGAAGTEMLVSEIVGVIGDVRGTGGTLDGAVGPEVYFPENGGWPHMQFAVRTTLPAALLEPAVRRLVSGVDASASLGHYATLAAAVDRSLAQPRLNAGLLAGFAVLSLVLVVLGVYGLIAFDVSQRMRELGLRIALGSTRGKVVALMLGDAARVLVVGLSMGFGLGFLASRVLAATALGEPASGKGVMVAASALLTAAVFAASLIPAVRAARVDPMEALKSE
jgi:putative ABC transport system permease protein